MKHVLQGASNVSKKSWIRIALLVLLMVSSARQAEAKPFFGTEETVIAHQYAYGNTCVEVVSVKTYAFGFLISERIDQRPFECNPN